MEKIREDKGKFGGVIRSCDCKHEFQDQRYGSYMRVHNLCNKGKSLRCTVCNKEKSA